MYFNPRKGTAVVGLVSMYCIASKDPIPCPQKRASEERQNSNQAASNPDENAGPFSAPQPPEESEQYAAYSDDGRYDS